MHSLQSQSSDTEQVDNRWVSRSSDIRGDTGPAFRDDRDALVSSGVTTWQDSGMILSPSPPPPPSAQPQPTRQPPMEETDMAPPDTHVASLKAIFPDFDDTVIHGVLESTDYDHDRALDVLLGMNDPSFVPPTSSPPPLQSSNQFQSDSTIDVQRLSQEALDEQFARRLALEEQEQAVAQAQALQDAPSYIMYQPYLARRGGRNGNGQSGRSQGQPQIQQGQGGRDTMAEFQDGFNRIAESGKKTFSSIVSKVKAKMQEFEQGQGWSGSQNPSRDQAPPQSSPKWTSPGQQQDSAQGVYAQSYANPQTSQPNPVRYSSSPPRSGVLRPAATEPGQPSYYDPNTRGYDLYGDDEDIQLTDNTVTAPAPSPAAPAPFVTTQNSASTTSPRIDNPSPASGMSLSQSYVSPVRAPSNPRLSSTIPPARSLSPTITGTKTAPDFSKLGLLPKRPISLVRPQSPPVDTGVSTSPGRVSIADSESTLASPTKGRDEPEFVENPFEDHN